MTILSCIVPVSKMANELVELETWIRDSSGLDIEIIIVHDVQDEGTEEQLANLFARLQDHRLRFIQEEVNSPGLARNLGLKIAKGKWIAFWDADDLPDAHQALASISENGNSEIIIGRYIVHQRASGHEKGSSEHDLTLYRVGLNPGLWRMLFQHSILSGRQFSATKMGEDQVFIAELNFDSKSITFTNRVLYKYFIGRPNQLTNSKIRLVDLLTTFERILIAQRSQASALHSINFVMLSRILITITKRFGIRGFLELKERLNNERLNISFREKCAILVNLIGIGLERITR
jgi:glycosyltransferase involved in cell wall biosynthesis